ncbi:hypothetical protein UlMin_024426 [Ulmus minor]
MADSLQRYQKLDLAKSLTKIYYYPLACKELTYILKVAYTKFPKNLQALVFQDILTAFRLLPGTQTRNAVSAAQALLHSAEAVLPKQKKNLAVTEFKQAMVAYKRRSKASQEERRSAQLPEDVLVHIFGFLDVQSLVSVALVSWSWNLAASDNHLWHAQYARVFGNSLEIDDKDFTSLGKQKEMVSGTGIDWKEAFRYAYRAKPSRKLTSRRGYCEICKAVVWLDYLTCSSQHQELKPVSPSQIVEYILDDTFVVMSSSSSDSDSDLDEGSGSISRLWAYRRTYRQAEPHKLNFFPSIFYM